MRFQHDERPPGKRPKNTGPSLHNYTPPLDPERRLKIIQEFKGNRCRCGNVKESKHSLCRTCFGVLPQDQQISLYRPFGQGYEQAYERAATTLDVLGIGKEGDE